MNYTLNVTNPVIDPYSMQVTPTDCIKWCQGQVCGIEYEFVWLFVIGFMFYGLSSAVFHFKFRNPEMMYAISRGLSISGYVLNLIGILWFIFLI